MIVSYGMCGGLGDMGVIVKNAVRDYAVMLVYSRFGTLAFVAENLYGNPSEGYTRGTNNS